MKRIFIWVAHPKSGSLCEGLADSYQGGVARWDSESRGSESGGPAFVESR